MQLLSFVVSVLFVAAAIIDYGFTLSSEEMGYLEKIYHFVQFFFAIIFTFRLITNWRHIWKHNFLLTIILGVLLYLSVLPEVLPAASVAQWFVRFYIIFTNKFYMLTIVGTFAIMEISRGVVSIIRRRTNPALLLASVFLIIIFFGTILLMVPRSTLDGVTISMVDALFVSTSAVCVTGLSPVDIAATFSTEGLIVIALLVYDSASSSIRSFC